MFTEWARKVSRGIVEPLAKFLGHIGLSANALTILGALLSILVGVVIAQGHLRLGGALLIVAGAFDALDGTLARQMGQATKFGAFLDSTLDRLSESAVLLGLAWWYMGQPGRLEEMLAYITLFGSMWVSYVRARAEGIATECKVGLFTRVERAILIIAALILGLTVPALWILAVGTILTSLQRIWHVYRQTQQAML